MKRVKKKVVGVLVLLVSIGSFYMWKQVQKHGKNNQQGTKQKYVDAKTEKPTIHVFDDNKFVFVAQKDGFGGIAFGQDYISVFDVHQKQINISRDKEQIVEQTWPRIREGVKPRLRRRVVSLESLGENIEAPRRRK